MEKNIQMSATDNLVTAFDNVMNATKNFVKKPFVAMRNYYSSVIGKEVTPRQAWLITEIQLAFMTVALPVDMSLLLRALAVVWFISSAIRTKASFE